MCEPFVISVLAHPRVMLTSGAVEPPGPQSISPEPSTRQLGCASPARSLFEIIRVAAGTTVSAGSPAPATIITRLSTIFAALIEDAAAGTLTAAITTFPAGSGKIGLAEGDPATADFVPPESTQMRSKRAFVGSAAVIVTLPPATVAFTPPIITVPAATATVMLGVP